MTKPKYQHKRIKFIQLNQMSERQLLVIVVLDNNHVSNKFINLMTDADENVIAQMNFLMNTALTGLDFTEINMAIMQQNQGKSRGIRRIGIQHFGLYFGSYDRRG